MLISCCWFLQVLLFLIITLYTHLQKGSCYLYRIIELIKLAAWVIIRFHIFPFGSSTKRYAMRISLHHKRKTISDDCGKTDWMAKKENLPMAMEDEMTPTDYYNWMYLSAKVFWDHRKREMLHKNLKLLHRKRNDLPNNHNSP